VPGHSGHSPRYRRSHKFVIRSRPCGRSLPSRSGARQTGGLPDGPSLSKVQRLILWVIGLVFVLMTLLMFPFTAMVLEEDLCLDRRLWWGPPESGTNADCSGHIYERRQAGYGPFASPEVSHLIG
jgi:hypothetical protein